MGVIVYLSDQLLRIVSYGKNGKMSTCKNVYCGMAPNNSIINGTITEPEIFSEFIKEIWKKNGLPVNDVRLMINSNNFYGSCFEVPKMSEAKTFGYVEREFGTKTEDKLYGYCVLGNSGKNMLKVYAECVSADYIEGIYSVFFDAGIKIAGIYSGMAGVIETATNLVACSRKNFVLQIFDDNTITTLLWIDRNYYSGQSMRSFFEKGSDDYISEAAGAVSTFKQFMAAHSLYVEMDAIYVVGIDGDEYKKYREAVENQGISWETRILSEDPELKMKSLGAVKDNIYVLSGMGKKADTGNFVLRLKKQTVGGEKFDSLKGLVLVAAIMIWIMSLSFGIRLVKQRSLDRYEEYLGTYSAMAVGYDMVEEKNIELQKTINVVHTLSLYTASYPTCDSNKLALIKNCAGDKTEIVVTAFDAIGGKLSLKATSDDNKDISGFVTELGSLDIFSEVSYSGYSYNEDEDNWSIHVTCILKGNRKREVD